jgi:hypothetical protein
MSEKEARDVMHTLLEMGTEEREAALTGWTINLVTNPNFNQLGNSWLAEEVFLTEDNNFLSFRLNIKSVIQIRIACFISKTSQIEKALFEFE